MATVQESVLRMEMADLEPQEEDVPKCVLFFKLLRYMKPFVQKDTFWEHLFFKKNKKKTTEALVLI